MVEHSASELDAVFHALGDATRRRMLRELSRGERTVSQLAEPFDMSLAAASKHIKALENAGLIHREVRGRTHMCRLAPAPLALRHHGGPLGDVLAFRDEIVARARRRLRVP